MVCITFDENKCLCIPHKCTLSMTFRILQFWSALNDVYILCTTLYPKSRSTLIHHTSRKEKMKQMYLRWHPDKNAFLEVFVPAYIHAFHASMFQHTSMSSCFNANTHGTFNLTLFSCLHVSC
jgi:hypothetical protein